MVEFYYKDGVKKIDFELVSKQIVTRMSAFTPLPQRIEIHFLPLDKRTYGGVDQRLHNRIAINSTLSLKEFIPILVHELIHVSQRETGQFTFVGGWYCWNGRQITDKDPETLPPSEYNNLPWEADVAAKQQMYLNSILKME